jgi:hypothetical protein
MNCWSCGKPLDWTGKIPFKATCDHCDAWLHVCRNCKFYSPGKPNDCAIPGTDLIADREKFNLCEEFSALGKGPEKGKDRSDIERRLFGDDVS